MSAAWGATRSSTDWLLARRRPAPGGRAKRALRTAGRAHRDDDSSDEEDAREGAKRSQQLSFFFLLLIVLPIVLMGAGWALGALGLVGSSEAAQHHADLTEFYRRVDRSKLKSVAAILDKYRGQEQKLYRKLKKKYGVSPEELRRRQAQD